MMKKLLATYLMCLCSAFTFAQMGVKYDPTIQATTHMQYFRPKGNLFVGDVMPFAHNGTFYNYWLLDSAHHASLNGMGGHQWALSTSTDLVNWKQHPVVIGIDEAWEKSICTGSVVFHKGKFYAFYATRLVNADGKVNEQLSYAISDDGINFKKQKPNPFYTSAPGYSKRDFRDPKVFVDEKTGEFHLLVSSWQENPVLAHQGGALVHMVSKDLKDWKVLDPILTGQPSVPECPDYFFWNGWWYLLYSDVSDTFYVKSRSPYGPWESPRHQTLNENWSNVVKTATFKGGRRIASSWVPSRRDNKDSNWQAFGGNLLFREVTQDPDGTLSTKFPPEMIPATGAAIPIKINVKKDASLSGASTLVIKASDGVGAASLENIPARCRITMEIEPVNRNEEYGFYLRSDSKADKGYKVVFSAEHKTVALGNTMIKAVDGLDKTIRIDMILKDDIIDIEIDKRRCIVNRTVEQKGDMMWFYAKHGQVKFKSITVQPLKDN